MPDASPHSDPHPNPLGSYLRNRRARIDPAAFGLPGGRRRTTGLRREEVAQRANISATWYTWLEQGRGGPPSADTLDRIAAALCLTELEREHLFLLGLGRPPEVRYRGVDAVTPRLQRLLDQLTHVPAIVRTATWDVVAWNRAASCLFTDYAALPPERRNILRIVFGNPAVRARQADWLSLARFVVGAFRLSASRAGADAEIAPLVEELGRTSPEFAAIWRDNELHEHGDMIKRLHHPAVGMLELEYSAFAVEGRPDLGMILYQPVAPSDRAAIARLIELGPTPVDAP